MLPERGQDGCPVPPQLVSDQYLECIATSRPLLCRGHYEQRHRRRQRGVQVPGPAVVLAGVVHVDGMFKQNRHTKADAG